MVGCAATAVVKVLDAMELAPADANTTVAHALTLSRFCPHNVSFVCCCCRLVPLATPNAACKLCSSRHLVKTGLLYAISTYVLVLVLC